MLSDNDIVVSGIAAKALSGSDWSRHEVTLPQSDKNILEMLKETGFSGNLVSSGSNEFIPTLGLMYNSLRTDTKVSSRIGLPVLTSEYDSKTKHCVPKGKGGSNKHQKKGVSADEIRHRKMLQKFDLQREQFLASWNCLHWNEIPTSKPNMTIDTLVLDFLQHIDGFCKNIAKIEKFKVYDLIFGSAKLSENLKVLKVRNIESNKIEHVNSLLISDLDTKLEELKRLSHFSIFVAASENPKFLVKTSYDEVIPNMIRVPYESQVELINSLNKNKCNGVLACLNTLTGEGKTTLIVGVTAMAQSWNREKSTQYEVIYCCSQKLKTIETQVGQNAWNALVPFGIAVIKRRPGRAEKVSLIDNYNCRKLAQRRVLIIADILSTILLLKQQNDDKKKLPLEQNKLHDMHLEIVKLDKFIWSVYRGECSISSLELSTLKKQLSTMRANHTKLFNKLETLEYNANKQYILFFDEPTVDLDVKDSPMVSYLSSIFTFMPKFTILSTATAPERESIPWLEHVFINKYPDAAIEFIKSSKVRIGSEISDLDGNIFIPHANIDNFQQYKDVVAKIEKDYFLQKCYTTNIVNNLFTKLTDLSRVHGIVIPTELNFVNYLNKSSNMNQDAICKLAVKYLNLVIEIASSMNETLGNSVVTEFCSSTFTKQGVIFDSLATTANHFESQTLIVTANPIDFTNKYFDSYITDARQAISKANGFDVSVSFDEIIKSHTVAKLRYNAAKQLIEEDKLKIRGVDGAEHEAQRKIRLDFLGEAPRLTIPDKFVIGSTSYMNERGTSSTLNSFNSELVNWEEVECDDQQKFALCLGIGLYSRDYSSTYTKIVLEMASKGQLAYLIANDVICYGANYPIENIIVDNTCLTPEQHSVKTVFQVFARAGRPGKSWRANIFAHSSVLEMIKQYIHFPKYIDIEIQNMNKALYRSVLDVVIAKKIEQIQKMTQHENEIVEAEQRIQYAALEEKKRIEREVLEEKKRIEHEALEQEKRIERESVQALAKKNVKYVPPHMRR